MLFKRPWSVFHLVVSLGTGATACGGSQATSAPDAAVDSPDATPADAWSPDGSSPLADVSAMPAFVPGPHAPLPMVPNQGGALLDHLNLVVITYADDPRRTAAEAFARWVVGSGWYATVGAAYGLGAPSFLGAVERTDNAPDTLTDTAVQSLILQGIQDGSLPRPPGGDVREVLYVLYLPAHTTLTYPAPGGRTEMNCRDFGAYHGEAVGRGLDVAYAVVPTCSYGLTDRTDVEEQEVSASHEIMEAALDPLGQTAPAWVYGRSDDSPWVTIGGEPGDLCSLPSEMAREGGHAVQRMWSNTAAMAGDRDPCIPASAMAYYTVTASGPDSLYVSAGSSARVHLDGWSTGPTAGWYLSARAVGAFTPTVTFSPTRLGNGMSSVATVTVPPGTTPGAAALVYVYSTHTQSDYHITPLLVTAQ